jgi:alpha-beta hydrolase superfamily lysophospholipase
MGYELSADEKERTVSWNELDDGSRRAFYSWPSERHSNRAASPVASILIVPGLGEHGGRYAASAKTFAQAGFDMYAIDLIGHGLSPGKRGCIASYDRLMNEIEVAIEVVAKKNPQLPIAFWGHSMGGNLVLNYLLRKSRLPNCAIASGPMLRSNRLPNKALLWLARRLATSMPNYQLKSPAHYSDCTRDVAQQALMNSDKLFHKRVDSGQWALDHAQQLRTPVLLVHGEQDRITSAAASAEFAERCPTLCELKILPDRLHDVHRDIGSEAVLAFMCEWLLKKHA